MKRRKSTFEYFSPRPCNLNYQSFILCESEEIREKETLKIRNMQDTFRLRGERLERLLQAFIDVFDVEFPEVSIQVKSILFVEWKKFDYNKELANANIQMVNFLTSIGATQALVRWNEIYEDFRRKEKA